MIDTVLVRDSVHSTRYPQVLNILLEFSIGVFFRTKREEVNTQTYHWRSRREKLGIKRPEVVPHVAGGHVPG